MVVDGDGPSTVWLCGGYRQSPDLQHALTRMLPPVVVVTAAQSRGTGLDAAVDLWRRGSKAPHHRPGPGRYRQHARTTD